MKFLLSLITLVLCATSTHASDLDSYRAMDDAASDAYRAQNYEAAIEQWSRALEAEEAQSSSSERARILHNLGNAALRNGEALEAVAHYRASLNLRPRNADTLTNLDFARTEADLSPAPRASFLASLTLAETERLVVFLAFALFLMLVGEAFLGGAFRPASIVVGLLLLGSFIPWAGQLSDSDLEAAMIVKSSGTSLRSEPRAGATSLIRLDPGTEHEVRDELPDWTSVKTEDGIVGWVKTSDLLRTTY